MMLSALPHHAPDAARLAAATQAQRAAYAPTASVWVSANAGTGKTTVLTQRILALLLADPTLAPCEILALTFTRVAAGEMAERLPKLVRQWAAKSPHQLASDVPEILGLLYTEAMPARLTALATAVVQTPPTLTTLHGFAQQVLAALPAVAGLPEGFGLLDESGQHQLLEATQDALLLEPPEALHVYLHTLLNELGDNALQELALLLVQSWEKLSEVLGPYGLAEGVTQVLARLDARLALPPLAEVMQPQGPTPLQKQALQKMGLAVPENEKAWEDILLTQKKEPKKNPFKKELRAPLSDAEHADLLAAGVALSATLKARVAWRGRQLTEALLVWAAQLQARYRAAKTARGVLDFTDLLRHLEMVLANPEHTSENTAAAWLWHRLDTRYRHLVVDEAQDNNASQSRIVQHLAANLLAGEVGGAPRTVLAVGDVKQSIYRFQGAQPQWFIALRELLQLWAKPALTVRMTYTFRNSPAILAVVNAAFATPELATATQGEALPWPTHTSVFAKRPARVELWPLETARPEDVDDEEPTEDAETDENVAPEEPALAEHEPPRWLLAHERAAQTQPSAKVRCLQRVAQWLKAQQAQGVVLPSTGMPLGWGDVLVVVRTNATAQLLGALCAQAGVPVAAGVGQTPLQVRDVVALLRVAYNRADNLALAQALKGLCGWSDAQLLALAAAAAAQGKPEAWMYALAQDAGGVKEFLSGLGMFCPPSVVVQRAVAYWGLNLTHFGPLLGWAAAAEAAPDTSLGALGSLVARLETEDLPAGQAFAAGQAAGARILTVHKAKGLEAPLVILPETTLPMANSKAMLLWGEDLMMYKNSISASCLEDNLRADEAAAGYADGLRGLYVGLTRATDWLVITGWEVGKKRATHKNTLPKG